MIPIVLCGALVGVGMVVLVGQLLPSPPHLKSAIQRLYPVSDRTAETAEASELELRDRLGSWLAAQPIVVDRVAVPRKHLQILGMTTARFYGEKLMFALIGLVFPVVLVLLLGLFGVQLPWAVPTLAGILLGVAFSFIPDAEVRQRATRARQEFTRALSAYLDLVALERKGGAGASKALEAAARGGDNWVFRRLQEELARARWSHTPAWDALADLAAQLEVPALHDVADIMRMSGEESTGVYGTLRARSKSLRNAILSDEQARANADNERMIIPVTSLAMIFIALLGIPAVMQIASG